MKRRKNKPPTKSAVDYIELLYNKYAPKLKYVAKQYIHNDTLAEDVLQNVFEKALLYSEKILELPDEKAFTFLYVIVRNTAYDMIKVESRNNHEELTAKKRCSLARSSLRALFEKEGLSYEYKR